MYRENILQSKMRQSVKTAALLSMGMPYMTYKSFMSYRYRRRSLSKNDVVGVK